MNINAISTNFMGTKNQYTNKNSNTSKTYTLNQEQMDTLELKYQKAKQKSAAAGAGALLGLGILSQILINALTPAPVAKLPSQGNTLGEAAEYMGIPTEIVEKVNNADENDILDSYIIPEEYTGFDDKITEIKNKLSDTSITQKEYDALNKELELATERKDAVYDMCGDIYINPVTDEAIINLNDVEYAEDVKYVLGIEEAGHFRDDADDFEWGADKETGRGYKDYTEVRLRGIIDCPVDVINP